MSTAAVDAMPQIVVVEPDEILAQHLTTDLQEVGYEAAIATDPEAGLQTIEALKPSLVVIDRMMAGDAGLQLCSKLRSRGARLPVLLIMGRDSLDDRIACLEAGADDYFLKPYRSDEFIKRVQLYLKSTPDETEQLRFADLVLEVGTRRAFRQDRAIELTMKEFELLKYLMEHPREVLARDQILENVWGYDFMGESNVIEVYIRYLRLKIENEGEKRLIQTVRGVGYVLRES